MRLELMESPNEISLFFEVIVYIWVIANKLRMRFDDVELETRFNCEKADEFIIPTTGRSSNTCPDVIDPSPIAILRIFTGGFWSPK